MSNPIYAMDTHFMCANNVGPSVEEQAQLVKACGYDAYYVTGSDKRPGNAEKFGQFLGASQNAGLGFAAAFDCMNIIEGPKTEKLEELERIISQLPDGARFEIAMKCGEFGDNLGNTERDEDAMTWLRPISELLEKYNVEGSLYPHFGFYLETFSDGLRLARKLNHPKVKVIFCGYHWFRVRCEADRPTEPGFAELFEEAGELLNAVNLCGTQLVEKEEDIANGMNPSIEPLDAGTMDNAGLVAELKRIGFTGPIGIQGFGVNDTAKSALERSFNTLNQYIKD